MVDRTIKYVQKFFDSSVKIVDLGCGSGCISITLSKELGVRVDAVDISSDALDVARENCIKNNAVGEKK